MIKLRKPRITVRKQPRQARAASLVASVLDAAVQVLKAEGASRFTVARVAERAGVSVGSIYQYFPNKASILFRLQTDEWRQTTTLLRDILAARAQSPAERLRHLTHAFIGSECEEAEVRTALGDAAPLYRHAPEADEVQAEGTAVIRAFLAETLPATDIDARDLAAGLIQTTLSQVGSSFSEEPRTKAEIATYADAVADMFIAYLEHLARTGGCGAPAIGTARVANANSAAAATVDGA